VRNTESLKFRVLNVELTNYSQMNSVSYPIHCWHLLRNNYIILVMQSGIIFVTRLVMKGNMYTYTICNRNRGRPGIQWKKNANECMGKWGNWENWQTAPSIKDGNTPFRNICVYFVNILCVHSPLAPYNAFYLHGITCGYHFMKQTQLLKEREYA